MEIGARCAVVGNVDPQPVRRTGDHPILNIEAEPELSRGPLPLAAQFNSDKRRIIDGNVELFNGRHQDMRPIGLPAQDGREQLDHRRPPNRSALVEPSPIRCNPHVTVAAVFGMPFVDRGQLAGGKQPHHLAQRK